VGGGQEPRETDEGDQPEGESSPSARAAESVPFAALLGEVPPEIRDVSFATAVRGYDRREVDDYVEHVNRIIAELQVSRSPQAAVKHALDRVGEHTSGVLQRAREVAEELTATALAEVDHVTRRAKVEAEETIENAQMQAHQLRGQSKEEADEILARATTEASERRKRAEDDLRQKQEEAEEHLRALRVEIDAAADRRQQLLDELRRTALQLEEFARGMIAGPVATELDDEDEPGEDPPTQRITRNPKSRSLPGEQVEPTAEHDPAAEDRSSQRPTDRARG
jgi:DivIVA domain-containing protein